MSGQQAQVWQPMLGLAGANNSHGFYTGQVGGGNGLWGTSLWQDPTYTQYSLNQDVINQLKAAGYSEQLLNNKAYVTNQIQLGNIKANQNGLVDVLVKPEDFNSGNYQAFSKGQASGSINEFGLNVQSGNNSMFGWGEDQYGNTTLGGATGFQWVGAGLGAMQALYGMYQGHKQMKMAKEAFDEQKRLSHANYQMQAKAYNNNLRNQQSGRSFSGMSGAAQRTLGSEYRTRKAKDDY